MSMYEGLIAATRQAVTFYEGVGELNNSDRLARLADALEESERERNEALAVLTKVREWAEGLEEVEFPGFRFGPDPHTREVLAILDAAPVAEDVEDEAIAEMLVARSRRAPIEDAEPVAYEVYKTGDNGERYLYGTFLAGRVHGDWRFRGPKFDLIPLYRAPQPAKPIEVTDEMVEAAVEAFKNPRRMVTNTSDGNMSDRMEAAIEAALKEMEKNR